MELPVRKHKGYPCVLGCDPSLDEEGYPTEEALNHLRYWDHEGQQLDGWPLIDFLKAGWWGGDFGYKERGKYVHISTGGWSGNEEAISVMEGNWMWWPMYFAVHRAGGHYTFDMRFKRDDRPGLRVPSTAIDLGPFDADLTDFQQRILGLFNLDGPGAAQGGDADR
jgi:hypothetical protein